MVFQPFDWYEQDIKGYYSIIIFGHDQNNEKICLRVEDWMPYVYFQVKNHDKLDESLAEKIEIALSNLTKSSVLVSIEKNKRELYYADGKTRDLLKVKFRSSYKMKETIKLLDDEVLIIDKKKYDLIVYEDKIPNSGTGIKPSLKMRIDLDITYTSWLDISDAKPAKDFISRYEREYIISWSKIRKSDYVGVVKPSILFYDLETYSHILKGKPGKMGKKDLIFMNGMVGVDERGNKRYIVQIVGKNCKNVKVDGCEIRFYKNDIDLIKDFCKITYDYSIISGYNIFKFDNVCMDKRLTDIGKEQWLNMSKLLSFNSVFTGDTKKSSSRYDGGLTYTHVTSPGLLWIDMYVHIKNIFPGFQSYKLDDVLKNILGESKVDFRYELINLTCRICNDKDYLKHKDFYEMLLNKINEKKGKSYDMKSPITTELCDDAMTCCAEYCVGDVKYLPMLYEKLNCYLVLSEEANIMNISVTDSHVGFLGTKTFPFIYYMARKKGIYLMYPEDLKKTHKSSGGRVLEVDEPGVIRNVVSLDFASLYPSIICAYCIDYTSYIRSDDNNIYGKVKTAEWDDEVTKDGKKKTKKSEMIKIHKKYSWCQDNEGILPAVERELKEKRQIYKIEMAKNKGTIIEKINSSREKAVKVLMNGIYGLTLTEHGLGLYPAGESICYWGREAQALSIKIAKDYGWTTIYGDTDSIFIYNEKIRTRDVFKEAKKLAETISKEFDKPMAIVAEKQMDVIYLYKSKNYAYVLNREENYKEDGSYDYSYLKNIEFKDIHVVGLGSKKRDTVKLAGELLMTCIRSFIRGLTNAEILDLIYEVINDMYDGKYDHKLSKLVAITKDPSSYVSKTYSTRLFAEGLKKDGYDIEIGERIETWIIKTDKRYVGEKTKSKEQIEAHKYKLDYDHYENIIYKLINKHIVNVE